MTTLLLAKQDIEAANKLLDSNPKQAAYFIQQAFEKTIKFLLQIKHVKYPRTHDISELLSLQEEVTTYRFSAVLRSLCKVITNWEAKTRYENSITIGVSTVKLCMNILTKEHSKILIEFYEEIYAKLYNNICRILKGYAIYGKAVPYIIEAICKKENLSIEKICTLQQIIKKLEDNTYPIETLDKYILQKKHSIVKDGYTLYPIMAIRPFGNVKCNEYGGYLKGTHNLNTKDNSWIQLKAYCYEDAYIAGNTILSAGSICRGNARIIGNVTIPENILLQGNIEITDNDLFSKPLEISYIKVN